MNKTNLIKLKLVALIFVMLSVFSLSANSARVIEGLYDANNDILDIASLRRGAVIFANQCMACHSVKFKRYNRVARDLGWTDREVLEKLNKPNKRVVDYMMASMSDEVAVAAFGAKIPDLSLTTRVKTTDYIYSFLRSFELNTETGKWDNKFLKGTTMPNVMPKPQDEAQMAEYDQKLRDVSNFLTYVGDPSVLKRYDLGWKVMLFLFIMFIFAYLLKREYWKDVT